MRRVIWLFIGYLVFVQSYPAQPFFGIPDKNSITNACSTNEKMTLPSHIGDDPINNPLQYSKTRVTFFGDSRTDLMNELPLGNQMEIYYAPLIKNSRYTAKFPLGIFYGMASLDFYLGIRDDSWNVQNFAQSGWRSDQLIDYLDACLNNPNHWIASNIAFEIGGNDYIHSLPILIFMPWEVENYVNYTNYNVERILTRFYKRRKNVLLIGNYATISYSVLFGVPEDGRFAFETLNFDYAANLLRSGVRDGLTFRELSQAGSDFLSEIPHRLFPSFFENKDSICSGSPPGATGVYYCWIKTNFKAPYTMASFGMLLQEQRYDEMIQRRKPYFANNGLTLDYIAPWNLFQSLETIEPTVVNHNLMGDLIHPNASGFQVWGRFVSRKIDELGWKNIPTPPATAPTPIPAPVDDGGEVPPVPKPPELDWLLLCFLLNICRL